MCLVLQEGLCWLASVQFSISDFQIFCTQEQSGYLYENFPITMKLPSSQAMISQNQLY